MRRLYLFVGVLLCLGICSLRRRTNSYISTSYVLLDGTAKVKSVVTDNVGHGLNIIYTLSSPSGDDDLIVVGKDGA